MTSAQGRVKLDYGRRRRIVALFLLALALVISPVAPYVQGHEWSGTADELIHVAGPQHGMQYLGFILVMFGFLLQWPTILTLVMFPVLVVMYVLLARREEREALAEFGDEYRHYAEKVPGFIPRWETLRDMRNNSRPSSHTHTEPRR